MISLRLHATASQTPAAYVLTNLNSSMPTSAQEIKRYSGCGLGSLIMILTNMDNSSFLEGVCKPLYDKLRPKITAETQLVKLCELCTLLQSRYMRDLEDREYLVSLQ